MVQLLEVPYHQGKRPLAGISAPLISCGCARWRGDPASNGSKCGNRKGRFRKGRGGGGHTTNGQIASDAKRGPRGPWKGAIGESWREFSKPPRAAGNQQRCRPRSRHRAAGVLPVRVLRNNCGRRAPPSLAMSISSARSLRRLLPLRRSGELVVGSFWSYQKYMRTPHSLRGVRSFPNFALIGLH